MKIRLDQIIDEPFAWDQVREIPAEELGRPELLELGPVAWRGQVSRTVSDFLLRATLRYEQSLSCSRCLGPASEPVETRLELLIQIEKESAEPSEDESETELTEDEMGVLHLKGFELDLEPLFQEQLQLHIPMRPLCKRDCQGLCPSCGADRNAGSCACSTEQIDPRWQGLAALKERLTGGGDE